MRFDVGMKSNPETFDYDHHQEDSPIREKGIPYSSIGLLWREYSHKICSPDVAKIVDKDLIEKIDAADNGIKHNRWDRDQASITLGAILRPFNSGYLEPYSSPVNFNKGVEFMADIFEAYMNRAKKQTGEKKLQINEDYFSAEEVLAVAISKIDFKNKNSTEILNELKGKYKFDYSKNEALHEGDKFLEKRACSKVCDNSINKVYGKEISKDIKKYFVDKILRNRNHEYKDDFLYFNDVIESLNHLDLSFDSKFEKAVKYTQKIIDRKIKQKKDESLITRIIQKKEKDQEGNFILNYPYSLSSFNVRKLVKGNSLIAPLKNGKGYGAAVIMGKKNSSGFIKRYFPKPLHRLQNKKLQEKTGIPDAIFCDFNGIYAGAETIEGVKKLSKTIKEENIYF
jgi:uncharacterized UPF0160 family protein